uniref:ADP-ribosyl cyclase/cyclic ADP-ribose hydrolase n=1 Tax=Arabidopsis thaliana TaxID=3702 RepID=B7U881_ARATH|nr:disease resistance protein RPP1-like protein R1 [Arabidopsis thaliana]
MATTPPTQSSETKPYSVLFVCLGNICRSPAAEGVFRDIVKKRGLDSKFNIDSAGTIDYHEGNMADPRMRSAAKRRGIEITSLSRPIKASDFREFDLILAMDDQNKEDILKAYNVWKARGNFPPDADKKVKLMCSYCKKHNDKFVPDPYYGGAQGFEKWQPQLLQNSDSNKTTNILNLLLYLFHLLQLSHIMESFRRKGIDTFIDDNMERGKSIGPELKEAIKGSKIAIVLLSKNYASSSWCLDELAEIMKCRQMVGQIVMTIFYEVDPTDIKKQTGEFGKAFTKTCRGKPKEHVENWRKALEDVATIAGEHSSNWRNEAAMIEKIATDVSNMLNSCTPSRDFDGLVGMRAHMDRMEHLLRLDLDEVRMIGIWGPPGIGKTTIARFLFNQASDRFQLSAIIVNIRGIYPRPCFDEYSAQLQLQNEMLSQMINHKGIMISHLGVAQERLRDKKVFLVLDEVDQLGQLDALAKETRWEVMALAGELPLGLKVLGSALRGKSKPEWERTLPRLKTSLDGKIGSIIQFSYDALCDEDKYLFLYIACLFNDESTTKVKGLLGKFLDVKQGERDICEVLDDDTTQLRNLKWMDLSDSRDLKELPNLSTATNLEELKLRRCSSLVELPSSIEKLTSLQILDLRDCSSLVELPSFGNATKLEKLDLENCRSLVKLPPSILKIVGELSLRNCSRVVELPAIENATNLRELKLQNCSSLEKLPSSIGDMTNLEKFDLCNCSNLVELPSSIGNLQKLCVLIMCGCSKLETLPININLKALSTLNLTDCLQLKRFPEISTHIELLMLTGTAIKEVPLSIMSWSRLTLFQMSYFESLKEFSHALDIITELQLSKDIQEVPPWVKRMSRLRILGLYNCNNLVSLPQLPDSLAYLYADNCKSLERLDCCFNNPWINLIFPKCFKLNQEARDLIMHTSTRQCVMLPGTQVPACFNHRATSGDSLKIKLKESPLPTTLRFKACIMLVMVNEEMSYDRRWMSVDIDIRDEQNDLKVQCTPNDYIIYPLLVEHIYTFEFEVEEVTSTELVFEFTPHYERNWKIRECGILQIVEVPSSDKRIAGFYGGKPGHDYEEVLTRLVRVNGFLPLIMGT